MNVLISQLLGDSYISLSCDTATCIDKRSLINKPDLSTDPFYALNGALLLFVSLLVGMAILIYRGRKDDCIELHDDEPYQQPPSFDVFFSKISVTSTQVNFEKKILENVSGIAKIGEIMAVMGPSGKQSYKPI